LAIDTSIIAFSLVGGVVSDVVSGVVSRCGG
jgi:hypothetical protein